jgi:hypothetical protein
MSTVVFGRTYQAVERAGVSAFAKPSRIALCTLQPSLPPSVSPLPQVILRPKTPQSYPPQKQTAQIDVTLIHSENPSKKNAANFEIIPLYSIGIIFLARGQICLD